MRSCTSANAPTYRRSLAASFDTDEPTPGCIASSGTAACHGARSVKRSGSGPNSCCSPPGTGRTSTAVGTGYRPSPGVSVASPAALTSEPCTSEAPQHPAIIEKPLDSIESDAAHSERDSDDREQPCTFGGTSAAAPARSPGGNLGGSSGSRRSPVRRPRPTAVSVVYTLARVVPERVRHLIPNALRRPIRRYVASVSERSELHWTRTVMNREVDALIRALPPEHLDAVEISGNLRGGYAWHSYQRTHYPDFDLCGDDLPEHTYDFVICEQVLEHVADRWRAAANLRRLCRPGGLVLVSTPFLIRVHGEPEDYWRFTDAGLEHLLSRAGLDVLWVRTWGNAACVRANFRTWKRRRPWHSLRNDPKLPVTVWALGRRSVDCAP